MNSHFFEKIFYEGLHSQVLNGKLLAGRVSISSTTEGGGLTLGLAHKSKDGGGQAGRFRLPFLTQVRSRSMDLEIFHNK